MDEVGNLAPETQQMLLRAIQERRFRPVGDKSDRSFNVRIIAATNEDLEKAVCEKRFRQDLLYRLHDFEITVPPLRDCQEDVMPLAEFFRETANRELECDVIGFDGEARKTLLTHAWPAMYASFVRNHGCGVAGTDGSCHERASGTCRDEGDLTCQLRPAQRCGRQGACFTRIEAGER